MTDKKSSVLKSRTLVNSATSLEALIIAGRKLQDFGFSDVVTITNQRDKDKLMNDTLFKVSFFGGRKG